MAFITFYDTTERDKEHLSAAFIPTDHHWEYVAEPISQFNLLPDSEVISVFVSSQVTREIIEKLPRLKLIACRSTGFNNIDLEAAAEHDVTVVNVPSYGESTVAEYAFALLLALTRRLPAGVRAIREPAIGTEELIGTDLHGKTLGVVGLGRIGTHAARIGRGFGMNLLAYDPVPRQDVADELGIQYVPLDELMARADVVSLHMPLLDSTRHMINAAMLSKLKRGAYFINTARGELVDTDALIEKLRDGTIAGAGLDVVEGETLLDIDNEINLLGSKNTCSLMDSLHLDILKNLPNVILTPHAAFNTVEAVRRINDTTARNIIDYWYNDRPNAVTATPKKPGRLVVVRHAESEWNATGRWTGTTDVHLSEKGFRQAAEYGMAITDITFDYAFCSQQIRTLETLSGILDSIQQFDVPYERYEALNERDYGDYTGMNKWEVRDQVGEEVFNHIRRDWNYPVPNGETLADVYERVIPFYLERVLPRINGGQTVLMVSHGNAIRALMKYIENIPEADMAKVEMPFGVITMYDLDETGRMTKREDRKIEIEPVNA